ncbi:diguanylate cyclase [Pseudomonas mucidolens]|uniref:diguanylate cyclase n=1 Tax=Pseudomonas mucidolens TaxID=46679 RepID=A0A1H2LWY9_9PSED|nr:diguanylate cyclase [Pseudomonas mucidolens]SDU85235.1 diguanylate cyclase [Pseudomonas mucidolens]SQH35143.1 diguanylate cyclase (GGDEF) domain protein, AdrA family [Pseudomonas mucidolens]
MENLRGNGLSFAKRIYRPRILGLAIGSLCVLAALYPLSMPAWVWGLWLFNAFIWPHLAYQLSNHAAFPYQAERRNLLCDSLAGGFWAAATQFIPLTTVTILAMMTMHNVAAGGKHLMFQGMIAQGLGIAVAWMVFGPSFNPGVSPIQVYACLPMLIFYPLAIGMASYRLAIHLSEHKRALSALSRTDSLTGLLNHGSWKDLLQLKFHSCQQQQSHATIALIDIDHFKQINDTYGHIVGDRVLRQLSWELRRIVRENDLAGRYGGDEFCVILPDVSLEQASHQMERLRAIFSRYHDPQVPALQVSLSIGLASYTAHFTHAHMWLNAADKALYAAKDSGRNRVTLAESLAARSA